MIDFNKIADEVALGYKDPIEAYIELNETKKEIETALAMVKEVLNDSIGTFEKTFIRNGYEIHKMSGRQIFDFSTLKKWAEKKNELSEIEKDARLAYQSYQRGADLVNVSTGEVQELPNVKTSSDFITYKKLK